MMPYIEWKEIDDESVTCADCEFYPDCDDCKEGLRACRYFTKKEVSEEAGA